MQTLGTAKRPRVLHIDFSGYGVMTHVLSILDHADHDCFEHCVLYATDDMRPGVDNYRQELPARGIESWSIPVRQQISAADTRAILAAWRRIGQVRPDVIHCHSTKAGAVGRLCALLHGRIPTAFTPHSWSFQMSPRGSRKHRVLVGIERALGRRTGMLTAVSETEKQLGIQEGICPPNRARLIPNGVDFRRMDAARAARADTRTRLKLNAQETVVCFIGRFAPQKMPNLVIETAAELSRRELQPVFFLLGNGPLEAECRELAVRLGVDAQMRWFGWQDYEDALRLLAAADVMLLPSRYEGLPYVALEAQAVQTVPVVTRVPGSHETVRDGETGLVVPFDDVPALASAVQKLACQPEWRQQLGCAGREAVFQNYNATSMTRALEEVYTELYQRTL